MQYIFTLIFLIIILFPSLYFYKKTHQKYYFLFTIISVILTLIKLYLKPSSLLIQSLFLINQFFIIFQLFMFLFSFIKKKYFLIFLSLSCTLFGFYSHYHKVTTTYSLNIDKHSSLNYLSIGLISDLHIGTGMYKYDLDKLVSNVNQHNYDLFVLCGDLFDEETPLPYIHASLETISHIKTKYGIFLIEGNHEVYSQCSLEDYSSITVLNDEYRCIQNLFNIVGRVDKIDKLGKPMNSICQKMNKELPTLILDHNPIRYKENIRYGDVQLSGHTHNGQIFPGQILTHILYDNAYGLLKNKDYSLIVTSGYGSWGFPYRFLTKSELVDIKLSFIKN